MLKRLQDLHVEYAEDVVKKATADTQATATVSPDTPFGQKTNLLSQHHQGFGITTRGLSRL